MQLAVTGHQDTSMASNRTWSNGCECPVMSYPQLKCVANGVYYPIMLSLYYEAKCWEMYSIVWLTPCVWLLSWSLVISQTLSLLTGANYSENSGAGHSLCLSTVITWMFIWSETFSYKMYLCASCHETRYNTKIHLDFFHCLNIFTLPTYNVSSSGRGRRWPLKCCMSVRWKY